MIKMKQCLGENVMDNMCTTIANFTRVKLAVTWEWLVVMETAS